MRRYGLWINNQEEAASGDAWQVVIDPATEEPVGQVPSATPQDVDRAVLAARRAFPDWRDLPVDSRVDLLHEVAQRMEAAAPRLAHTLTLETGRLLTRNALYVSWAARVFRYYAELSRNEQGRVIASAEPTSQLNLVLKQPYGVVACIVPWNYPILLLAWKLAPALAAGNTVVIKPASQTPLATLELMQEAFAHLPPGVVNVITGPGSQLGDALVRHPSVPLIAFTGSTEVGQRLMRMAAQRVKKLHLELGGKDPALVFADAPLDTVVQALAWGAFLNGGQVCTSVTRIYVQSALYEPFVARLGAFAQRLRVGSGFDPEAQITPMISAKARDTLQAQISGAVSEGARLVTGGAIPADKPSGFFYLPTVLADVHQFMRIQQEETFGPLVTVQPFVTVEEAIVAANDSPYGLGAGVYTQDPRVVHRVAREVSAGTIWVNEPLVDNIAGPFGGTKESGIGRELGQEGLEAFRQVKHLHWSLEARAKPWYFQV